MPTYRVNDETARHYQIACKHFDHYPTEYMVFVPGTYEHICEGCGQRTVFVVGPNDRKG